MLDFFQNISAERAGNNSVVNILIVIWAIILGMILAFFLLYFRRRVIGSLVRAIVRDGATDESTAKTLSALGQSDNESAIRTLEKSASLRTLISVCPPPEPDKKGAITLSDESRLYISQEKLGRARIQYGETDKLWVLLLCSAALIAVGILASIVL